MLKTDLVEVLEPAVGMALILLLFRQGLEFSRGALDQIINFLHFQRSKVLGSGQALLFVRLWGM